MLHSFYLWKTLSLPRPSGAFFAYMNLTVRRVLHDYHSTASVVYLDGEQICYGLEDEPRDEKVAGQTRIPAGTYKVKLRTEGGFHQRYSKRFPDFHRGMLHVIGVPGFEWILIHCGNTHEHTAGCLLVGEDVNTTYGDMRLSSSVIAYEKLYRAVVDAATSDDLTITYIDDDIDVSGVYL